jgi:nitrate/nitrite transport system ATP-binding protein
MNNYQLSTINYPSSTSMNPSDKISSQTDTAFLSIDNVSKVYNTPRGPYTVLDGVNLEVAEGEFICIIGHSGCGKSTLLNMVSGFNQPTNGTVKLHDKPILEPGPDRMMVFQNYCLLPWKSAYDNVQLAVNSVYPDKSKKEKTDLAQHYLEMVGLTDAQEKKPHQLSGGMKQRVAIARALSISPEVLILDEPFGALDAITKEELQEELLKIWRETQLTVLMITHDIDEALFLADRLVMMTNGPSAKIGEILEIPFSRPRDRAQITEDPRYYELRNYALDFLFHRFAHDEDDEVKEEEVSNQWGFKKIAGIIGGLAAIAFVGYGFFNIFAPKGENTPQPAVQTPAKP